MKILFFAPPIYPLMTPETVKLRFKTASPAGRLAALLLDILMILLGCLGLALGGYLIMTLFPSTVLQNLLAAVLLLCYFFLRNLYFIFFELKHNGRTPGKKKLGLQVIARDGGTLTANMVFARNFLREVEFFLPLTFILTAHRQSAHIPAWLYIAVSAWIAFILFFPAFNRYGLRLGDLAAGTLVVMAPRPMLLADLVSDKAPADAGIRFSKKQLDPFGVKQLKALEAILRMPDDKQRKVLCREVYDKIVDRLELTWEPLEKDPEPFLKAFYSALRAELERKMLLSSEEIR